METATAIIQVKPEEFGIEQSKAQELVGNLPQIKAERSILEKMYEEVILLDIEDAETAKKARELRLKVKDNRTKGLDKWHADAKEVFLRGGQFIDAIKRQEIAVNKNMEENLEKIEKHFENKEKERIQKLNAERVSELEPYNAFVPIGINLGEISDEEYAKILNGAKLQFEHQQEEERKAEAERQRLAEIQNLYSIRKDELIPLWQFVENKEANFGEMSEELFASIKSVANSKKIDHENEQERIRKENEKLAKEKADAEAKAKKAKEDADKKLEAERKKQEEALKIEREKQAKLEAELQAKKDAEAKAEADRLAEEKRKKEEAEKLAKAPIKEQLTVWINSFSLPEINTVNETETTIKAKFDAFKKWALSEVEKF